MSIVENEHETETEGDTWYQHSTNKEKSVCLSCGTKKTPRWHKSRFLCNNAVSNDSIINSSTIFFATPVQFA